MTSGKRQRGAVGANYAGPAPLLRAGGNPVGDGTAGDSRHGVHVLGKADFHTDALFNEALCKYWQVGGTLTASVESLRGNTGRYGEF